MIINEIKLTSGLLFLKKEVVLLTDQGKISLDVVWDEKEVGKLNEKLKGFSIESADDFDKLKEIFGDEKYKVVEKVLLKSIKKLWRFFDPAAVQIPRPVSVVYSKEKGIKEFVVFSLNAKSFDIALNSNLRITDYLDKKIKDDDNLREEDILMFIREAIDKEHEVVDFEIRVGVVFDKYNDKQFEFVSKLIDNYGIVYVENPFDEGDFKNYKKLTKKYGTKCLICMNSKINEYTKGVDKLAFNTLVAKFVDVSSFRTDISFFKDNKMNIVVEGDVDLMNVFIGLGIPLVKLRDDSLSRGASKKIVSIGKEIFEDKHQP